MEEIWRDVVILDGKSETDTYKGKYQVSNLGNVKSLNYRGSSKEKLLLPQITDGYYFVYLYKDGKRKSFAIHRLVGFTFLGDTFFENAQIDHINTIRTDNNAENLKWVTPLENSNNELSKKHKSESHKGKHRSDETKIKISNAIKGNKHSEETKAKMSQNHADFKNEKHPRARAVICITTGEIFNTCVDAIKYCGLKSQSEITSCCKGRRNYCGKHPITKEPLKWAYLDEYTQQQTEDTEPNGD